jgi:hypothetical protein
MFNFACIINSTNSVIKKIRLKFRHTMLRNSLWENTGFRFQENAARHISAVNEYRRQCKETRNAAVQFHVFATMLHNQFSFCFRCVAGTGRNCFIKGLLTTIRGFQIC